MGISTAPGTIIVKSTVNSSIVPLAANATFTGVAELNAIRDVMVSARSDAGGILYVDFSTDGGVTYDSTITYVVTANTNEIHTIVKGYRTFRVRLVNGSTNQTFLRLHVEFGEYRQITSSLSSQIQQDADAITVRAITEETAIAVGLYAGYSIVNKLGRNSDIDTATVPEDIWTGGGTYTGFPDSTLETISLLSDSASDTSAGTGARTVNIIGLDTDYNEQSEVITLNGTTPVASVNTYRRMHTMSVRSAGSGGVNAGAITARHTTTTSNIFNIIQPGFNQSFGSGYTVPAGYAALLRRMKVNIRLVVTAVAVEGVIWTRSFGSVFRARRPFSANNSLNTNDEIYGGLQLTEKSDIILRVLTVTANNIDISGGYDLILIKNT